MQRRNFIALATLALATWSTPALAKRKSIRTVLVATPRVQLGQIMDNLEDEVAEIDLGPAPAPNGTRMITKKKIEEALEEENVQGVTGIPKSVRVKRKMQTLKPAELIQITKEAIAARGLKKGITLTSVKPPARVKIAAGWDAVRVRLPKNPRRKGKWSTTAMLSFDAGGERIARVAVRVTFHLTEEATRPDIKKGTQLTLTVQSGRVAVSVKAYAGADADVGDTFNVQLRPSGRLVRAKLVAPRRAVALGGSR